MDEAGVQAALAVGRVLGHVGRRAAVLAAQRQALQQAQHDQDDRREDAQGRVAGQDADQERRQAHQHDGDQEGVLAPDHVAEPAEHQRAERPHREAGGEGEQGEDELAGLVEAAEELLADDDGERAVQIEVVPLEDGAEAGGEDHLAVVFRQRRRVRRRAGGGAGHGLFPR
ncbi:hypothetical protein CATMIT_01563, partial [Catenibacterium mitsuokai DSM 15897]